MSTTAVGAIPLPFHGRTIDASGFVILLGGGVYLWELVQSVSIDWKIITGNRGCRWGAFLVYFPFRILVVAFYVCAILGLYELKPDQAAVAGYIEQSTILVARVGVYHVFAFRVCAIWKHRIVSYILQFSALALEGLSFYGISQIRGEWYSNVMPSLLAIYFLCLINALLPLYLFGLLRARRIGIFSPPGPPDRYSTNTEPLWKMFYQENIMYVVAVWIAQCTVSLAWLGNLKAKNAQAMSALGMTDCIVIIICGCRQFQSMTVLTSPCPTLFIPSVLATIIRAGKNESKSLGNDIASERSRDRRRRHSRYLSNDLFSLQIAQTGGEILELQSYNSVDGPSTHHLSSRTPSHSSEPSSLNIKRYKRSLSPSPSGSGVV